MSSLAGLWAPAATPVGDDLAPLPRLLAEHVARLLDEGCHGVVLFGTTGEASSFSVAERRAMLDAVLDHGVPADRLMVGVGCCALPDTLELARGAAGCAALLVLPPFYFKDVSDRGLQRYYRLLLEDLAPATPRVLIYHFPRLSGVPVPPAVLARLAERFPGVVAGVKDSSGDSESLRAFVSTGLDVFPGTEMLLLEGLRMGAAGAITAGANVNAGAIRAVYDAFLAGDPSADASQEAVAAYRRALQRHPMIPAIKRILAERTGEAAWVNVRPPLVALDAPGLFPALGGR